MHSEACLACGFQRFSTLSSLSKETLLRYCQLCGTACTLPKPTAAELEKNYSQAYYGPDNIKFLPVVENIVGWITRRRAGWLHRKLRGPARILEIGCGRGLLLTALAQMGHECHGTERSELAARRARMTPGIKVYVNSLEESKLSRDYFDLVVLWHVLEHLDEPVQTLDRLAGLLRNGGILVIEVPNFSSWQSVIWRKNWFHLDIERHLYHFSKDGLFRMLKTHGFRIQEVSTFSLEQGPFGVLQSLLNCLGLEPQGFYKLLKREISRPFFERLLHYVLAVAFLVPSSLFAILESRLGRGGVLRVTAQKLPISNGLLEAKRCN